MDQQLDFEAVRKLRISFDLQGALLVPKRVALLEQIKLYLKSHYQDLLDALKSDLNKGEYESLISEIAPIFQEIDFFKKRLKGLLTKTKRHFNINSFLLKTITRYEPLGLVLIIGAFNYPLQLVLLPLIGALAAGNKALIKFSEFNPATHKFVETMVQEILLNEVIVIPAKTSINELNILYRDYLDKVFFTGSEFTGKKVYQMAAEHSLPLVLELGGANPTIVLEDANLENVAQRLIWSKLFNKGQTCVNPNYVLVAQSKFDDLKKALLVEIDKQYDEKNIKNIVREIRARKLILEDNKKLIFDKKLDGNNLVFYETNFADETIFEESFNSFLPFIVYRNWEELKQHLNKIKDPLTIYLFTEDQNSEKVQQISQMTRSGSLVFNDLISFLTVDNIPFGGIGKSGIGNYHGQASIQAFSYPRTYFHYSKWDFSKAYKKYPYTQKKLAFIKKQIFKK